MGHTPLETAPVLMPTGRTTFDPPAELKRLRGRQPLCRLLYPDGHVGWLVTNHTLGRAVLSDARFSMHPRRYPVGDPVNQAAEMIEALRSDPRFADLLRSHEQHGQSVHEAIYDPDLIEELRTSPPSSFSLNDLDPPSHTRLKRMLAGYFTVRRVSEHRETVQRIVTSRLDAMEQAGPPADLYQMFTLPISSLTMCALLGAPASDRHKFEWPTTMNMDLEATAEARAAAFREFRNYTLGLIRRKRAYPADDLLSNLALSTELTDDELAVTALLLFGAGHETTANTLALATLMLLNDRQLWQALKADSALIGNAVEELLRYATVIQSAFNRTALQDVELGGEVIRAGESVTVSLAAANRDPDKFPEPDKIHLNRSAAEHLAFGHGIHQCIGQHLARLELQMAITGLIHRFPQLGLDVAVDDVPPYRGDRFAYGVQRLPVTWKNVSHED
jgi:cytochrome P450